jgi:hypothetical protein
MWRVRSPLRSARAVWRMSAGLAWLGFGCSAPAPVPVFSPPLVPAPTNTPPALPELEPGAIEHASIPRFFEVGSEVSSGGSTGIDTNAWVRTWLERASDAALAPSSDGRRAPRLFIYSEPDPVARQVKRYALELPRAPSFSANDRIAAYWSERATAFDFAVGGAQSAGNLSLRGSAAGALRLRALFEPARAGALDYELIYELEGSGLRLLEHKGLVPGLPVAFERFTLYRADPVNGMDEPRPIAPDERAVALRLVLRPAAGSWQAVESRELGAQRVLLGRDAAGDTYFLAAESALGPRWYAGSSAAGLVARAGAFDSEPLRAGPAEALALLVPEAARGTLLTGRLERREAGAVQDAELADYLAQASAFLSDHDAALADLRQNGPRAPTFAQHFVRTLLDTHRSQRDPRQLTELPYADARPSGSSSACSSARVSARAASLRYGSDHGSVLLGLANHQRQSGDRSLLEPLWSIAEASLTALTPSGAVYDSRFDGMELGTDEDDQTGRADVFITNGAVAAVFNHLRLVLAQGARREPGATWGAFGMWLDGRAESVDQGGYGFSLDADTLPLDVRRDQDELRVTRLFTRADGRVRVHETAAVSRGVPALRVSEQIENTGNTPLALGDVRLTVGDFFHYADGSLEISQGRYGMSPVLDGVPLHVGVWMQGADEPLWGDAFAPGWVDVSQAYRVNGSRVIAVYGYDRAQLYFIPERADEVWLFNAAPGAGGKDGYGGWTTLLLRYRDARQIAPGASHTSPPVYSYTLRAPLASADDDGVPDELQSLVPLWAGLLDAAHAVWPAAPASPLAHLTLVPDRASVVLHLAWAQVADRLRDAARGASGLEERHTLEARARRLRQAALRGAAHDLTVLTHLRNRTDLMPSYGSGRNYGYHVPLFEWAHRQSADPRYRDAMLTLADRIALSDRQGGLQVTDPNRPNYGAYWQNELPGARGTNRLDDQGIKLWALRVAFAATGDPKYRASAALFVEHWLKLREEDQLFYGTSKVFDRYVVTGAAEERTPLGQYAVMVGLAAWSDLLPLARDKYMLGLKNASGRHPVHAIGTSGVRAGVFPDERVIHYDTSAELGGLFLMALAAGAERRGSP